MGTRDSFSGVKRLGVKLTTHLHLVPKSRMRGAILALPQYAFMACCSVKAQGQLYLYLYILYVAHTCVVRFVFVKLVGALCCVFEDYLDIIHSS
jgi:hypothetical protein